MKFFALFPAKFSDLIDRTLKITQNTRRRGRSLRQCAQFRGFCSADGKTCAHSGQMCGPGGRFFRPAARRDGFLQEAEEKAAEKGSPPGPIPPIRGKCPEGTKGVGMLSPKVTERLLHICGDLSVSASPSHLPWEGRPWGTHSKASPMRGSCRRRRLMRWGQLRRRRSVHLIRHGSAVPPSPRRGRQGAAPAQKKRPSRSGRALGMGAYSV